MSLGFILDNAWFEDRQTACERGFVPLSVQNLVHIIGRIREHLCKTWSVGPRAGASFILIDVFLEVMHRPDCGMPCRVTFVRDDIRIRGYDGITANVENIHTLAAKTGDSRR